MVSGSDGFECFDRLVHGNGAARFIEVKQFRHLAIHFQHALAGVCRISEGFDHGFGLFDVMRTGREDAIG